jgi:hypothetical protein
MKQAYEETSRAYDQAMANLAKSQKKHMTDLAALIRFELDTLAKNDVVLPIKIKFAESDLKQALEEFNNMATRMLDKSVIGVTGDTTWANAFTIRGKFDPNTPRQLQEIVEAFKDLADQNPEMRGMYEHMSRLAEEIARLREES